MQQVIIAIHLMVVTALVILVLYQKSEGGALGMGGGSGVFTGRGQANALTRATGILATIFFITSIALTVLPAWERRSEGGDDWTKSLEQGTIQLKELPKTEGKDVKGAPEQTPEPGKDSIFDQLQRAQQKRQQGAPVEAPPAATTPPAATPPAATTPPPQLRRQQRPPPRRRQLRSRLRRPQPLKPPSPPRRPPRPRRRKPPSLKRRRPRRQRAQRRPLPARRRPPRPPQRRLPPKRRSPMHPRWTA